MKQYATEDTLAQQAKLDKLDLWRSYACTGMIFLMMCLLPLMSHAGGLGIAALAFFLGQLGYLTARPSSILRIPAWFWPLAIFLIWANITASWSPYEDSNTLSNPVKIGFGTVLFLGCILAFKSAIHTSRRLLAHLLVAVMTLSMGLLLIDILSGYGLTFLVDPLKPDEDPVYKAYSTEMNLGHAVTVLALFLPVLMMLIYEHMKLGWIMSVVFAFMLIVTSMFAGLAVGVLSVIATLCAMFAARLKPEWTLKTLIWIAIFSILLAPLMGYLAGFASDEFKAALPFSWEHRLEMWTHTAVRIFEHPIIGHGFDAVRTFDVTFSSRGIESWPVVSLHPHNAGLHLWAETGLIGVALAVVAILVIGISVERFVQGSKTRTMAAAGIFAAIIVIGNLTYGVWQDWWWAAIILTSACVHLISRGEKELEDNRIKGK